MVFIKGGIFMKGPSDHQHQVKLSAFFISKTLVTNEEYEECVHAGVCKPTHYDDGTVRLSNGGHGFVGEEFRGAKQPVVAVDWNQAKTYCGWKGGRLPTDAEWEYACRAGSTTKYYWGNEMNDEYAWHFNNSDNRTHTVGQKKPNAFGLFDMSGNVFEWCSDWFSPGYITNETQIDPKGPVNGKERMQRGGSWARDPEDVQTASMGFTRPDQYGLSEGFRCVRSR